MKQLFLLLIAVCFAIYLPAQTTIAFHEDFESSTIGLVTTADSAGFPTSNFNAWAASTHLYSSGLKADSNKVQTGKVIYLTSNSFSTIGKSVVNLEFAQICKLFVSDGGNVEVSINGGTIWVALTTIHYRGSGLLQQGKFCDNSYSTDWAAGTNAIPTNAWWKNEKFDISAIAANQANVKIRFKYLDSGNSAGAGRYGWLLDDIKVTAANNELDAPRITFKTPVLQDTLFVTGPFTVQAYVKDAAALSAVNLIYNVNGGSNIILPMLNTIDSTYIADIPSYSYGSEIKYKIQATDMYGNTSTLPTGYKTFYLVKGLDSIQVGTTTTAGLYSPIYIASAASTYLYSYSVSLFEKNEILSGGTIESLAFNKTDAGGYTLGDATLRIYMKETNLTYASGTYTEYTVNRNGAILVYENTAQNLNTAAGWQTFLFNTGSLFNYTGSENLMVFVEWYRPGNATAAVNWQINTAVGKSGTFYGAAAVPTLSNTTGQRANIKFNFQTSNAEYDATVLNFGSPTQIMTAGISVPVTVRVKNLGTEILTTAEVHWMLDGVYQGANNWTGSLQQDFVDLPFTLGNVNLTVGPHILKAWTELPNDSLDQTPSNDTTTFNIFACNNMSGAYTVGAPTSNFPTFDDVFNALSNCGIIGPVTFKIESGTYNHQLIIPLILNVSPINTVTFESASGNNNDVIFEYAAAGTSDNFVLRLDASKYVTVKNITFKALGATYGRVAELSNAASYNTIEGCKLEMPVTTSTNYAGIYTASTIEQYNTFRNNQILNGYYGIYNYGTSTSVLEKGNVIEGNTIKGFYYYGIYSYYQDSTTINSNIVENGVNAAAVYGIQAGYNDNLVSISNNKVNVHSFGSSTVYGIYVYYCDNIVSQPGIISNNFISQSESTGTVYGLSNYTCKFQNYFNNSVNVTASSATYGAFYTTGGSNAKVFNNNFINTGGGYAYYISTIAAIDSSDYNNLYTTGTNLAYWSAARTTLAALKAVSLKDINSKNVNPQYVSLTDLHIINFALAAAGTSIPAVTTDIDGEMRNTPPCIGADEFIVPMVDAGLAAIMNPASTITVLNQDVKVTLKNYGILPLTSATIQWSVNGVPQTPFVWTGNLIQNANDTILLGNYTFNLGPNALKVYSELPNNQQDIFGFNDTLVRNVYACSGPMSGSYTIGGLGADFSTINNALLGVQSCGISGPVVFNINQGTYNEQVIIPAISGTSAVNTITFKSTNNDSTSVIIDAGAGLLGNFVIKFNAAQFIKFEKLTVVNDVAIGRAIEIAGASKYITISNCILKSSMSATSALASVIFSDDSKDEYITIQNNLILGGYHGVYFYGVSTTSKEKANLVRNNIIKDFFYYGTYFYYQDSLKVIGNLIQNRSTAAIVNGLYSGYTDNSQYLKNNIQISGSSTAYGMYLYYNNNTAGTGLVSNNFISQTIGTSGVYGIYCSSTSGMNFYSNSINVTKGSTSGYAFYITSGANCNLLNNNLVNTGGGYAYYASSITAIATSNYNNLFVTGTNLGYWSAAKTNLAAFKLASGKDVNSVSVNPAYFSATNLHSEFPLIYAKGISNPLITEDFDGQIRPTTPCIGADEFVIPANEAAVLQIYTFGKLPVNAAVPHNVKAIVTNKGYSKRFNLTATLSITGANTFTNSFVIDSLLPGEIDTITFADYNPAFTGNVNVKVSFPTDEVISNNEINYKQIGTDSLFGYADTSAVQTSFGIGTASEGYFVSKYKIKGSRNVNSVKAFITNSNTIGQRIYAVVMDSSRVIIDTSASKIITAQDVNSWVSFPMSNPLASNVVNKELYVGIAQTLGTTGSYYPLGCQKENYCRSDVFYYSFGFTTINLVNTTQYGRFMIDANLGYPNQKDVAVTALVSPISKCDNNLEQVKINIINTGVDTIYGGQNVVTAHYGLKYNGNLINIVSQTVTDTIVPLQINTFTFTTPLDISVTTFDSSYHVVAWVDLLNDTYPVNDTTKKTVTSYFTPVTPVVATPVNIGFGSSTTLTAVSNDTVKWFANIFDIIPIATGNNFITPLLSDTSTYYYEASTITNSAITLGTGTINNTNTGFPTPYGLNYTGAKEQYLIRASELQAMGITAGRLTSIGFDVVTPAPASNAGTAPSNSYFRNYTIKIGSTALNALTATWITGLSQVYMDPMYVNISGWNNHIFATPYIWDGLSNIVIETCYDKFVTGSDYSLNAIVNQSATSFVSTNSFRNDVVAGACPSTTSSATYSQRPNIKIDQSITRCASPRAAVVVNVAPGSDATVSEIITPNSGCGLSNQVVKIRIKNKGNIPVIGSQNALTAHYGLKLNGNIIDVVSEAVPNSIGAGDSIDFSFSTILTLVANVTDSNYTIIVWNTLLSDLNIHNDTITKAVTSKYTSLAPVVSNVTVPYGNTATFNIVTTDSIYWYANLADINPIATGSSYTTPPTYNTTNYYVAAGGESISSAGISAPSTGATSGSGTTNFGIIFDALSEFTLNSVTVYPVSASSANGTVTIDILNSLGVVLHTATVNVTGSPAGSPVAQVIPLNFTIAAGTNLKMRPAYSGISGLMFEPTAAAPPSGFYPYPFVIPGVVSIKTSTLTAAPTNTPRNDLYYYFYDWKVKVGGCASSRVNVTATPSSVPALDIAVTSITEPVGLINSGVATAVKVALTNYGTTTVTSATINWSVNGIVQTPLVQTAINLISGQISAPLYLGDYNFTGGPAVIKTWSSLPNGLSDMFPANDTVTENVMGCLTGTLTIGTNGTFPTFNAAINVINTAGICGNVIFDVLPGTYNEVITINQISTSGPNNTVTFRSQNGINTSVILTSATGSSVVKLNGADYIRFENMTIKATATVATTVELSGGSDNNIFNGNIIELQASAATTNRVINSTATALDNYNQFTNNTIKGGYYGIYWYGASTLKKVGNVFNNNIIKDFFYYGMYIYYNDSLTVSGNTLNNASNSATVYGLYSYYTNSSTFTKNKINITGSGTTYCMYIYYNNSTGGGTTTVANNFISQSNGATTLYGISNYYSNNVNYYNNSVNITGGTTSYYAFYSAGGSNSNVVNNIFSNTGGGYAYYVSTVAGINTSNNNNFYSNGPNLAYWTTAHTTLASLKTGSGKDLNSLNINPNFNSTSDLHLMVFDLNGKATPLTSVVDDIDGDIRNTTTPDMGADEFNLPTNDAGISAVIDPMSPSAVGVQNVKVTIRNFGAANLTSANIQWSVNGILQTPFAWSANLVSGDTNSVVIGNYNFTGGSSIVKVWTNLPNGSVDGYHANDTIVQNITFCTGALAGTYTIGGTSANFSTITAAVQSLYYCGISAPVTFNINQGTYNEQLVIDSIPGTSDINTITFKSANNDSTSVVISYAPSISTANYVLKLNNAEYIRFKHLSIVNTSQNNMGRVVELMNNSNNNEFSNNLIKSGASTVSTSAVIYSYNTMDERNTIANNLIQGGYYGIYLYGVSTAVGAKEKGNIITNNIIKDFYYYGMYLYTQDSVVVTDNIITNATNSATAYGMYLGYNDNAKYLNNKIQLNNSGSTYGMYVYYNNNVSGSGLVANNFVSQSVSTGTVYGIYNYYSTNMKYYYNSINVTAGGTTNYSMYFYYGAANILKNNNVVNTGGGFAIYANPVAAVSTSDYNNFFTTGGSLGSYLTIAYSNLATWQTAIAKDTNSVSFDPDYISATDLHVYTSAMNNKAQAIADVTTDIDGQTRSLTTPDIGADEYTPLSIDLGVKAIMQPVVLHSQVGGNIQIKCIIKNFGADSVTNFNIVYKAGNMAAVSQLYTTYLHANTSDTVIFTSLMPVVAGPIEIQVFTSLTGDGNHNNDTTKINYFGVSVKNVPYAENFDNTTEEWFSNESGSQWERGVPSASVINTPHSAPNVWATNLNGNYTNTNTSVLYTPIFNNAIFKADTLRFWHWMDAENNKDGGSIEYQSNSTGPWTVLGSILPDTNSSNWYNGSTLNAWTGNSAGWQQSVYKISNLTNLGNTVQFRFVFNADAANNNNGWAIDNFELTLAPIAKDAGVVAITSPAATSLVGENITVSITVQNFGLDTLTNIPVKYQVGNGLVKADVMAGPIAPGATSSFTFTAQPFQVGNQSYAIRAYTEVFGDIYIQNDTTTNLVTVIPALNDVAVTEILMPGSSASPGTSPVKVVIKNFGTDTQTSIPVSYRRGSLTPVNAIWTGSLVAGATVEFTFPAPMTVPNGSSFSICAYTILTNDAYTLNDTLCKSVSIGVGINDVDESNFWLGQNMPNPTTGLTNIEYNLPVSGEVKFDIINLVGQKVYSFNKKLDAGKHFIDLDVKDLSSGVYYYTIEFKDKRLVKKMVVNK